MFAAHRIKPKAAEGAEAVAAVATVAVLRTTAPSALRVGVQCSDGVAVVFGAELDDVLGPRLGVGRGGVVE